MSRMAENASLALRRTARSANMADRVDVKMEEEDRGRMMCI